jgi:hypothetical protein
MSEECCRSWSITISCLRYCSTCSNWWADTLSCMSILCLSTISGGSLQVTCVLKMGIHLFLTVFVDHHTWCTISGESLAALPSLSRSCSRFVTIWWQQLHQGFLFTLWITQETPGFFTCRWYFGESRDHCCISELILMWLSHSSYSSILGMMCWHACSLSIITGDVMATANKNTDSFLLFCVHFDVWGQTECTAFYVCHSKMMLHVLFSIYLQLYLNMWCHANNCYWEIICSPSTIWSIYSVAFSTFSVK